MLKLVQKNNKRNRNEKQKRNDDLFISRQTTEDK